MIQIENHFVCILCFSLLTGELYRIVYEFKVSKTARCFFILSVHRQHGGTRFGLFFFSRCRIARFFFAWRVCARQATWEVAFFFLAPASYGFKCKFRVCWTRSASVDHPRILPGSDLRKNSADGQIEWFAWLHGFAPVNESWLQLRDAYSKGT